MQVNAIQSMVAQMANVQLIPRAPLAPGRKPSAVKPRVLSLGPTIVALENQGLSQVQIGKKLSLAPSSICSYRSQYVKALRAGLV